VIRVLFEKNYQPANFQHKKPNNARANGWKYKEGETTL
jgi:hypothetical protein